VTILIVEDNPAIRRLIKRTIESFTNTVYECADGASALDFFAEHHPDLVFMDIRMPRMDGLEATRRIMQLYPKARIVIVTDYDVEELRAEARSAGAIGYTLKENLTELGAYINEKHP
jgi:two-component system response regulator DegU